MSFGVGQAAVIVSSDLRGRVGTVVTPVDETDVAGTILKVDAEPTAAVYMATTINKQPAIVRISPELLRLPDPGREAGG